MAENKEPERRDIHTSGNYIERLEGDYIHNVYFYIIDPDKFPQKENEVETKQKTESEESQNTVSPTKEEIEIQRQIKERVDKLKLPNDNFDSYSKLRELLNNKEWEKADWETIQILLNLIKRENNSIIKEQDIQNIPCSDFLKIDLLWLEASNNKFGFSVQLFIWLKEIGSELEPKQLKNIKNIRKFGNFVGWYKDNELLKTRDNYTFSLDAPLGHLPSLRFPCSEFAENNTSWKQSWERIFTNFLIHTENCTISKFYR